ncbi:hypothetical protein ACB098_09G155700 [Castanea mollissima]
MGCLSWKYQVLCLLSLLLHSIPSCFSSSLSSISPCPALHHFNHSLSLHSTASPSYYTSRIQLCDISYPKTASWKEDKDCCTWDGVVCDKPLAMTSNLAGNYFNFSIISSEFGNYRTLTHLNLSYSMFSGKMQYEISHLSSLVSLDLSYNFGLLIETLVWNNLTQLRELLLDDTNIIQTLDLGFNSNLDLGSLPKCNCSSSLKFLALSSISFSGELPKSISNPEYLKHLDLSKTRLLGEFHAFMGNLKSLKHLDLSYYNFTGSIPTSLGNLLQITYLDLRANKFTASIPTSLENLTKLTYLDLSYNSFSGEIQLLNLDSNQFIGEIGEFKSNSLEHLDLGYNRLQGSIPRSISTFVNLTYLSLSSNNWSIMLELQMFSKLKNLWYLDLSNNLVSINNNVTCTLPKLERLNLSSCNISEFLMSLRTATNLLFLDLSKNRIYGQFPRCLGDMGMDTLYFLDLSDNLLQGPFPTQSFLSMQYLFVSNNKLTGEIPSLICNSNHLEVLDLSHNNLSGMIPKCLVYSDVLLVLDLRMNSLHSTIPTTPSKGNQFRNINLNGNQLEGPLPRSLANCRKLEVLDLGSNKINGTFPHWLEGLLYLRVLVVRSNKFQGRIGNPKTKFSFPNLQILDISNNEFDAMTNMDEGKDSLNVMMKGLYIELVRIQTVFTTIDFSNNSFRGEMPKIIGRLKSLKGLNFSHNNLTGYIPSSFGNLHNLEWEIPWQLVDLPWLEVLKLSHNQLTGFIPSGKQFNTFDNDS